MVICNDNQLTELLENGEMKRSVNELVICSGCSCETVRDLKLRGFDNLNSLVMKEHSLNYQTSLEISNNPVLKTIEIEGDRFFKDGSESMFFGVSSLILESDMIYD